MLWPLTYKAGSAIPMSLCFAPLWGRTSKFWFKMTQMHLRVKKQEAQIPCLNSPLEGTEACHYLGAILLLLLQRPSCLAF